jgi:ferrochelatase
MTENVRAAMAHFADRPRVVFTAHSVPLAMAGTSPYVRQLEETCGIIADRLGLTDWRLVYQSRSGPPGQPWLEPDILDYIRASGTRDLVIVPIGFISDHMEVLYDLDTEAADLCEQLGIRMVRAATVGTHPEFVGMILDLAGRTRNCNPDCCPRPQRPATVSGPPAEAIARPGS